MENGFNFSPSWNRTNKFSFAVYGAPLLHCPLFFFIIRTMERTLFCLSHHVKVEQTFPVPANFFSQYEHQPVFLTKKPHVFRYPAKICIVRSNFSSLSTVFLYHTYDGTNVFLSFPPCESGTNISRSSKLSFRNLNIGQFFFTEKPPVSKLISNTKKRVKAHHHVDGCESKENPTTVVRILRKGEIATTTWMMGSSQRKTPPARPRQWVCIKSKTH